MDNIRRIITEVINTENISENIENIAENNNRSNNPQDEFIEMIIRTITSPRIMNSNNILDQSFREEENIKKPLCLDFKSKLERITIGQTNIEDDLSCSICQERFKLGENAVILPCKGQQHYFHADNTEDCNGIMPWFEENNTCPMCRCEFPEQKNTEPTEEPDINPLPMPASLIGTNNTELSSEQRHGLSMSRQRVPRPYHIQMVNMNMINNTENINRRTIREESSHEEVPNEENIMATNREHILNRTINHDINNIIHSMRRGIVDEEELMQRAIMRSIEDQ